MAAPNPLAGFWKALSPWHQAAAMVIGLVFAGLLAAVWIGWQIGIVSTMSAPIWAAMLAAGAALTTFWVGRLAQDLTQAEERRRTRLDLAVALYAEIRSNLLQQRAALTQVDIAAKVRRTFPGPGAKPAAAPEPTVAGEAGRTKAAKPAKRAETHSLSVADDTNPLFKQALDDYERIPSAAIIEVVEYYNLDGMFTKLNAVVSSPQFDALSNEQKAQALVKYWQLGNEVDDAAERAMAKLLDFVSETEPHFAAQERQASATRPKIYRFDVTDFPELKNALPAPEPRMAPVGSGS